MKKKSREAPIQIRVFPWEKVLITENARRNGMSSLSEYLRILGLSKNIVIKVDKADYLPEELNVREAQLGSEVTDRRKGAAG